MIEVQGLVVASANESGLSQEERNANQLQIDSILQTIDRIAQSTSFQGSKLLNGTYDFTVTAQATTVSDFTINGAKLGFGETRDVEVVVTQSAQYGALFLSATGGVAASRALDLTDENSRFTFELAGAKGSREFTFSSGTTLSSIADAINTFTSVTGVSAVASGSYIELKSDELGSNAFVRYRQVDDGGSTGNIYAADSDDVNAVDGATSTAFSALTNPIKDSGQDVGAIINGVTAQADGGTINIATDFLDLEIELSLAGATNRATIDAFTIESGGAKFNLGPNVDILNQVSLGIENVAARNLGSQTNGFLSDLAKGKSSNVVDGDLETAQKIVTDAIKQISSLRGRLGAFQKNTIGATIRSLGVALENTSAAESAIRDTDFASETANLTRSQILVNAATNTLGIANAQPQSVLPLLG